MKSRIFIGSSGESEHIAKLVKTHLEDARYHNSYECVIWKDHFFQMNQSTYRTLVKKSIAFDFAIFIGGKDDLSCRLGKASPDSKIAPRDNVYLEFGLYAGILSEARSYFLIDKGCMIASDLCGITVERYENEADLAGCCEQFHEKMQEETKRNRITLLPSTSLAVGYVDNYLAETAALLYEAEEIEVDGKTVKLAGYTKKLEVVIPRDLQVDWKGWLMDYYKKREGKKILLRGRNRVFDVRLDGKLFFADHVVRIMDVPLTLISAFSAVELFAGNDYIGEDETVLFAKEREVRNFILTLENKARSDFYLGELLRIVRVK